MKNRTNLNQSTNPVGEQPKAKSPVGLIVGMILIIILIASGVVVYLVFQSGEKPPEDSAKTKTSDQSKQLGTTLSGKKVEILDKVLKNKFGWLSAGPDDASMVNENGGAWVRPHPGGFLWDQIQSEKDKSYDFSVTDSDVAGYGEKEIGILATIWPFAEWDQVSRSDAAKCAVSSKDEFLPTGRAEKFAKVKKETGQEIKDADYLPLHRCNPSDWEAYQKWVTAMVERYDGDGLSDMSGLKMPIKYWEVMNEPDLDTGPDGRLDFYKEDATAYAKLLVKTSEAIRAADPDAKILIAGAAGGNDQFLGFYREVLQNKETVDSFDIGNVHCISNDSYDSFNVEPYKNFLTSLGISKPVWVTEAEAKISNNTDENATQVYNSTKKALELGAERIFYTMSDFINQPGSGDRRFPPHDPITVNPELKGKSPAEIYKIITSQ